MRVLFVDCINSGNVEKWKEVIPIAPRKICGILKEKKVEFEFTTYFEYIRKRRKFRNFDVLMISGMFTDL